MIFLTTDSADIARINFAAKINHKQRSEFGQFFTPTPIARFLANQFINLSGNIHLLDAGAGVGILTAAFVEKLLTQPEKIKTCFITVYEIEENFLPPLKQCLSECCLALQKAGIKADYCLHNKNFIEANHAINLPLLAASHQQFTHAILNPPYKKINNQSLEKKTLSKLGIDTVNLYSAFIWLTILQLVEGGEIAAITPRSFCNGTYFRPFRKTLLQEMALNKIHIFTSRSIAFSADKVLQENIIFHAIKTQQKPKFIEITNNIEYDLEEISEIRLANYHEVVHENDGEMFIHIVTNSLEKSVKKQMENFPSTLEELGLEISTGPIVDFRLKTALKNCLDNGNIPLLYPESLQGGKVCFPPIKPRKPIAIEYNEFTYKWLIPNGCYVLTKRFSAKEDKRRIVAAIYHPIDVPYLGIENHLNYYHAKGKGMDTNLAKGLTAFLNSTIFDNYFRQFSGHTQVNATDLRKIKYPLKEDLIKLGRKIGDFTVDQNQLDIIIEEILPIMTEAKNAIQASKRIQEALAILKEISAPKEQQNERSALCLLALANIQSETPWNQATAPKRRITEMMDWFRDYYGKQYAPNTRETVRRKTMHQFVQMGLVIENPDQPDRPINSPKWCYQLHPQALSLLRCYASDAWEKSRQTYLMSVTNLLQENTRNINIIPVILPDGKTIQISAGGQNPLIKNILENFCPRFTPGGVILYVGDAGDKFIINEIQKFREIGLELDPRGKMPDVVVYYQQKEWLILIEAVTSHGPINLKRRNELKQLFQSSNKGLIFITAFPSRKEMTRYLAEISWETEVWLAEAPEHIIHFNGERLLNPL